MTIITAITDGVAIVSGAMEGIGRAAPLHIRRAVVRCDADQQVGEPEGFGEAHVWLCSEDVSFVTRERSVVDRCFCNYTAACAPRTAPHPEIRREQNADDE